MAGLEGTVKTPFGEVQKKTGLLILGGAVLIGGIVWYRSRNLTDPSAAGQAEINPATGYPYGSAEDAASLAQQAAYISPAGGSGGGGSSNIPSGGTGGFTSNQAWSQAAIEYMTDHGLIEDPSQLIAALGKYLTGAAVDNASKSLIEQAIAVQGYPPIAGPDGYPPHINQGAVIPPPSNPPPPPPPITDIPVPAPAINPNAPLRRFVLAAKYTTNNPPLSSYLNGIAQLSNQSRDRIAEWNNIAGPQFIIYPNQKIWVDPPTDQGRAWPGEWRIA